MEKTLNIFPKSVKLGTVRPVVRIIYVIFMSPNVFQNMMNLLTLELTDAHKLRPRSEGVDG